MPIRLAATALVAALGGDLLSHLLSLPAIEEAAHLATLLAMVGVLFAIVTGAHATQATDRQGDRHAIR
jgi:hypothetical protein